MPPGLTAAQWRNAMRWAKAQWPKPRDLKPDQWFWALKAGGLGSACYTDTHRAIHDEAHRRAANGWRSPH